MSGNKIGKCKVWECKGKKVVMGCKKEKKRGEKHGRRVESGRASEERGVEFEEV